MPSAAFDNLLKQARRYATSCLLLVLSMVLVLGGASCGDELPQAPVGDAAPGDPCAYPSPPYVLGPGGVLEDLVFQEAVGDHDTRPLSLGAMRACGSADAPDLLVLRVVAGFCGPCRWMAAHTGELLDNPRVRVVDVLVRGADGSPPTAKDAAAWRALRDRDEPSVVLDPEVILRGTDLLFMVPATLYIDTKTMRLLSVLANADADAAAFRIVQSLARIDGEPAPRYPEWPVVDGWFTRMQWEITQQMRLPDDYAPPPDPTDALADDPRAVALGHALFDDPQLSSSGTVSCASCHDPARGFADGVPRAVGVAVGDRNTPSLLFAAHQRWQFWDGRADTLWAQALGPLENPLEMASTRTRVVKAMVSHHAERYAQLYGAAPDLTDPQRFPDDAMPGTPAWEAMQAEDRELVTSLFVRAGKAIAAFERALRAEPTALDRYLDGDKSALTADQIHGLHTLFTAGCVQCHWGPRLTDDAFHNVRFATGRRDGVADLGREQGLHLLGNAEFGAASRWSDAPTQALQVEAWAGFEGQFKTPPLRGMADTAPYGHGGTEADIATLMVLYAQKGLPADDPRAAGTLEPWIHHFDIISEQLIADVLGTFHATPRLPASPAAPSLARPPARVVPSPAPADR